MFLVLNTHSDDLWACHTSLLPNIRAGSFFSVPTLASWVTRFNCWLVMPMVRYSGMLLKQSLLYSVKSIQRDGFVSEEICYSTLRPRTRLVCSHSANDLMMC